MQAQQPTKTSQILELTAPVRNRFQGPAKRLLFCCSVGMLRSPTAAKAAVLRGHNARSCGSDVRAALVPISLNLIAWADKVFFMQARNYHEALEVFKDSTEALECIEYKKQLWSIDDNFEYDDKTLLKLVRKNLRAWERA